MIDIIIQKKKISKTMILSMRSKDLKVRVKKANDLYFKTERVKRKKKIVYKTKNKHSTKLNKKLAKYRR